MRFDGDWDRLPEFSNEFIHGNGKAGDVDRVRDIGLVESNATGLELSKDKPAVNRKAEHIALHFTSGLAVESSDVYVFELTSDDGSQLWIDGELVVDNDGLHSALAKRGRVALGAGWHQITVNWFNKTGGAELSLKCGALGAPLGEVPLCNMGGGSR
jgi:hypothetical protein